MIRTLSKRRRRSLAAVLASAAIATALAGCGGKQDSASGGDADSCEAPEGRLTIATGNSTGVYFVLGGGMAQLINSKTDLKATAAETGASVQNVEGVVSGDYDMAFSLADTAADAVNGTGSFDEAQPIESLGRIYTNYTQVVVRKGAGISSIEDMAGKAISTGSPQSGTEVIATRLLETAGLDIDSDIDAQRLDLEVTVDAMKDGSVDGFFWSGGIPTAGVTDLFTSMGGDVEFLDITPQMSAMQEISPVYQEGTVPAATYDLPGDVKTIVVPNLLVVKDDFAPNTACAITTLVFENKAELEKVHPAAAELDPKLALETDPVPLNDGSQTALDELGS